MILRWIQGGMIQSLIQDGMILILNSRRMGNHVSKIAAIAVTPISRGSGASFERI